jgi:hypothetical protein
MVLKDFLGKVVIGAETNTRYVLTKIHAAYITVGTEKLNVYGTRTSYLFKTDNEDPFTSGALRFEDASLTELFKKAYQEYCRSEYGRAEAYLYWVRMD